jgi:hypothetical protein
LLPPEGCSFHPTITPHRSKSPELHSNGSSAAGGAAASPAAGGHRGRPSTPTRLYESSKLKNEKLEALKRKVEQDRLGTLSSSRSRLFLAALLTLFSSLSPLCWVPLLCSPRQLNAPSVQQLLVRYALNIPHRQLLIVLLLLRDSTKVLPVPSSSCTPLSPILTPPVAPCGLPTSPSAVLWSADAKRREERQALKARQLREEEKAQLERDKQERITGGIPSFALKEKDKIEIQGTTPPLPFPCPRLCCCF